MFLATTPRARKKMLKKTGESHGFAAFSKTLKEFPKEFRENSSFLQLKCQHEFIYSERSILLEVAEFFSNCWKSNELDFKIFLNECHG